jgi:hypothetical protein
MTTEIAPKNADRTGAALDRDTVRELYDRPLRDVVTALPSRA